MNYTRFPFFSSFILFLQLTITYLQAGVVNPDISAIGQIYGTYTDDSLAKSPVQPKKFALALGETELNLDASLNPYFKGAFVLSIGGDGAVEVEEAYASMIRGLPLNLALKAGKYRLGFGKLNQAHPHAYPFIRTPRVLSPDIARLLPGEESFNDVGIEVSTLIPVVGDWAITPSVDFVGGRSFHPDQSAIAHGWLAHLSNSFFAGPAAMDIGASATQGINNISANMKTTVLGLDAKAKVAPSATYTFTIGGEYLYKLSKDNDTSGIRFDDNRYGFYVYIDNRFFTRYNAGALFEQYQDPTDRSILSRAIKPFVGFSVLEESTIIRASYEYFAASNSQKNNTVELQFLFSMGPHKAHLF